MVQQPAGHAEAEAEDRTVGREQEQLSDPLGPLDPVAHQLGPDDVGVGAPEPERVEHRDVGDGATDHCLGLAAVRLDLD
jgi:hypothetical protein